jgi:hypothetical protein
VISIEKKNPHDRTTKCFCDVNMMFSTSSTGHRKSAAFLDVPTINLNYLQVSDGDDDDNYRLRTFSASKQGEWLVDVITKNISTKKNIA